METNTVFLNQWKQAFEPELIDFQEGFKKTLKDQLNHTEIEFIHALCRKIDLHKKLYECYDASFQKASTPNLLDEKGSEAVFLLLAIFISKLSVQKLSDKAIALKCINSLLKARDNIPLRLKSHSFIPLIYTHLLPIWL